MIAGADKKLPFGNLPRLLLAWVTTEAVRTQSRELILGDSLSEFMRELGVYSNSGRVHIRLRNQMRRLFQCHVQLVHEHEHGERFVSSAIADQGEFWWNERKPEERSLWQSKIELSEKFFNEIIHHPVPLDMNTLTALKRSPLGLDLYMWAVYRTFSLNRPMRLSWPTLYRQLGVDPSRASDNVTVQRFRKDCLRELKKIKLAWPDLNYNDGQGGASALPLEGRHCSEMKSKASKISIADCRKAIEIKGHLWLTIRGEQVLITKLAAKGGRWVSGDIRFTRYQQECLTGLARFLIAPPKTSIADCRKAIEIAGSIPLTIRDEEMRITEIETRGSRWVSGDIRFTPREKELLTEQARRHPCGQGHGSPIALSRRQDRP